MMRTQFNAGRFLRFYGLVFSSLTVSLLALSWAYLQRIGELNLDAVVDRQLSGRFCLFGSGIEQDNYTYKLALYGKIRPDIAILGSSRVMQVRGRYFQGSFVNLGGAAGSTVALAKFVDEMLDTGHAPKLAIIGLDFWWFNPAYAKNEINFMPQQGAYAVTLDRLKLPLYWLLEDKVKYRDIGRALFAEEADCRLGVMARQLSDGFGPDGSYYYTSFISGQRTSDGAGFQETLSRIAEGRDRFEWGDSVSREDVERLVETVQQLDEAGSKVVLFMPPLATPVYRAIRESGDHYRFFEELPAEFRRVGLQVHDYTDPATIGSVDCEFVDGFHGGEITYARLLKGLAQHEPALAARVRAEEVRSATSQWSGFAMVANRSVTEHPETDFLGFGCPKHAPEPVTARSGRLQ